VITDNERPRVFYGWWIVGACFFIALSTSGVIFFGFTAVFEPIANEFGWSYAQISLAASLRGLEIGLFAPFFGMLVDHWGPRKLIFSGIITIGLGLILLSRINSLSMFYAAFALIGIGTSACSSTILMTAAANWFRRKVSLAAGIIASGFGFSGLLVPVIVTLINMSGWRMTMVIFSVSILLIGSPLSLLIRHKPEQYGYLPDGEISRAAVLDEGLTSLQTAEEDSEVRQALKSRTFWQIALSQLCHSIMVSAVITHVMPYLSSIGIARAISSLVASAIPLLSIGGRLGFGWLGDKVDKRQIMADSFAMMGLGLLCFEYASTGWTWLLVSFIILFSIGFGGSHIMRAAMLREYFGRRRFGTIFGSATGVMMIGNIVGAPLAGWAFDNWGSYQSVWSALACLAIISIVLTTTTPRPQPGSTKGQSEDVSSAKR